MNSLHYVTEPVERELQGMDLSFLYQFHESSQLLKDFYVQVCSLDAHMHFHQHTSLDSILILLFPSHLLNV